MALLKTVHPDEAEGKVAEFYQHENHHPVPAEFGS